MADYIWTWGLKNNPTGLFRFCKLSYYLWAEKMKTNHSTELPEWFMVVAQAFSYEAFLVQSANRIHLPVDISSPKIWGPPVWKLIRETADVFRIRRKKKIIRWFRILSTLLPCETCRANFSRILIQSTPRAAAISNKEEYQDYLDYLKSQVDSHVKKTSP